ncbi:polyprenyl synthetase family protein [Nitratireductor kimnyeongensis]|uniref:Polyprenyl synthetase family protein n=1 Tax=Nitratireductor kimnyeongensis TaxID=430679 RepID=A0ABW0TAB5_9HYPH|nr:farnesyl diphosphate synthase [Nitratireductor kimnyeongensis]QZZ37331.1 polyprenyl synthetase family protein [Nitratireductor kimnyeongensis]
MEETPTLPFEIKLAAGASLVENTLHDLLAPRTLEGELHRPERLLMAMRHGVLNGGKRLRPFLVLETAALFETNKQSAALRVAAALECVHCYSLVHDDLPAMDDDDLRRGQPTVHRAFDEAAAILAGDSLLTFAFDIISASETDLTAEAKLTLVNRLARASGMGGMAGGQALDLAAEGSSLKEEEILLLQSMKTGALIRFACEAGSLVGGAQPLETERLAEFGSAIGLAFQLADDLLDLTSNSETMGKATGKDAAAGKATLASLHGIEWTRRQLNGLVAQAEELLEPFGERAETLREAARFVANRQK